MKRKFILLFILLANFSLAYAQRTSSDGGFGTGGKGGNGSVEQILREILSKEYIFNTESCNEVLTSQRDLFKYLCIELDERLQYNEITVDQQLFRLDCCLMNH